MRSRQPGLIGVEGIVLQETENAFRVITVQDRLLCKLRWTDPTKLSVRSKSHVCSSFFFFSAVIPKANSVFAIVIDDILVNIYGNQFW